MREKILGFLRDHPQTSWKPREIAKHLGVPVSDKKKLKQLLKKLDEEGVVLRHRGRTYSVTNNSNTLIGTIKLHPDGYGFVLPEVKGEIDVFVPASRIGSAHPADKVLVSFQEQGDGRREGRVIKVLERGRKQWVGRLEKKGKQFFVLCEEGALFLTVIVDSEKLKGAHLGEIVSVKIVKEDPRQSLFFGDIESVLGKPDDESTQVAAILAKHHIKKYYPKEVQMEVAAIPEEIDAAEIARRVDLRDKAIVTIDGLTARDFDDAVLVEKKGRSYHLYVSIADVAHYVRPGSPTDVEAFARGTSVYFSNFAVAMLPEKLSNNLCSLKPGEDRLTLTCEIRFDEHGVMKEAWIYESVIRSAHRGVYDDIQSFLDSPRQDSDEYPFEIKKNLLLLKELSQKMMVIRDKRGAINFDLPETEIVYDVHGKMVAFVRAKRFFSHRLIEECMVAANVMVAEYFARNGVPALYRVHDIPDEDKIGAFFTILKELGIKRPKDRVQHPKDLVQVLKNISDHPMELFLHQILLRSMKVAVYSPENHGHFGLALKNYSHFTSPIRRYPDLVTHRQLKRMLSNARGGKLHVSLDRKEAPQKKSAFYTFDQLNYIGGECSKTERTAMEAEREMVDYKRAQFLSDYVGDEFLGVVRRIAKFGLFVELQPHFIEGLLHVRELNDDYYVYDERKLRFVGRRRKKVYRVGQKIKISVKEVSLEKRQVELALA